jgi:hypothetical protein
MICLPVAIYAQAITHSTAPVVRRELIAAENIAPVLSHAHHITTGYH